MKSLSTKPPTECCTSVSAVMRTSLHSFEYSLAANISEPHVSQFKSWSKRVVTEITPVLRQNCSKLMDGDSFELERIVQLLNEIHTFKVIANFSNCVHIWNEFYNNFYVSESEKTFPIAYALVVYTNAMQILRFLKAIYRPQNLYCIHPDPNSGKNFTGTFKLLSSCLPNVFVASHIQNVKYTSPTTIFEAQMSCFRDLKAYPYRKWHYVINLCSRELPLKTNRYIVEGLRKMNGTSIVKPHSIDKYTLETRFSNVASLHAFSKQNCSECPQNSSLVTNKGVEETDNFLVHYGINLYKSMAYNALSRSFVHYILQNETMQLFKQWILENCHVPEEHFYATAYMMPGAPGGYHSQPLPRATENIPQMFKTNWKHLKYSPHYVPGEECSSGKVVHEVCILNSAELPRIKHAMKRDVWFFNKYFLEDDHVVMDCVEEELVRSNRLEFAHDQLSLESSV